MNPTTPATQEDKLPNWVCHPDTEIYKGASSHLSIGCCRQHEIADGCSIPVDVLMQLIDSYTERQVAEAEEVAYERGHLAGYELGKSKATTEAYKSGYIDRGLEELGGKNG